MEKTGFVLLALIFFEILMLFSELYYRYLVWKTPLCPLCNNDFNTSNSLKNGPFCSEHGFLHGLV